MSKLFGFARTSLRCWTTVLAPPVLWAINFEARYALSNAASRWHSHAWLHVITLATTLLILASAYGAWRWQGEVPLSDEAPSENARFMLQSGVALGLFFAFITLTDAIPALILSPTD